jgi:DnaK suppressor protein
MKKKSKTAKPVKKTAAKKPAPKKAAPKKAVKKATPKKVVKKAVQKVAPKKAAAKKPVAKPAAKKPAPTKTVTKATAKPKAASAPKATVKPVAKAAAKTTAPKNQKGVVTTVLPPKLGNARVASSAMPAQAAVKAPKAPQAKLAAAPVAAANARKRLNKDELKFFENLLNEKKETLLQEQSYLEDNALRLNSKEGAGDLSSHAYHLADHATETQDREQAFHLASREGKFLYYIEEALDRVRAGTFGICKKCGVLIPKPRLIAVPTAKMCINCKSMQEHAVVEDAA